MLRNITLLIADYIILFAIISILCGAQVVTLFIDSKSSSEYVSLKTLYFCMGCPSPKHEGSFGKYCELARV